MYYAEFNRKPFSDGGRAPFGWGNLFWVYFLISGKLRFLFVNNNSLQEKISFLDEGLVSSEVRITPKTAKNSHKRNIVPFSITAIMPTSSILQSTERRPHDPPLQLRTDKLVTTL
jgi:hypothetical protein